MMRFSLIALIILVISSTYCSAQYEDDAGYGLVPKILPVDTTEVVIKKMLKDIDSVFSDYKILFVDSQRRGTITYVYKSSYETLKVMYRHREVAPDDTTPVRRVVTYAHITADKPVIVRVFNYIFRTEITQDEIVAYSANGTTVSFRGSNHQFIFMPNDMKPGYWDITFIR